MREIFKTGIRRRGIELLESFLVFFSYESILKSGL